MRVDDSVSIFSYNANTDDEARYIVDVLALAGYEAFRKGTLVYHSDVKGYKLMNAIVSYKEKGK